MLDIGLVSTANFEVLIVDLIDVMGPLLASLFIAAGIPEWGLIAATVGCTVGSLSLSMLTPVKTHAARNRKRALSRGDSTTALPRPRLLTLAIGLLLLVCLGKMCYSGWLEALIPLFYSNQGTALLGSIAISAWSVGAAFGVVLFNRFQPEPRTIAIHKQLPAFRRAFLATTILTPLAEGIASMSRHVCHRHGRRTLRQPDYQLSGLLAPEERQAEMFSWLNTATSVGVSSGAFFAGCAVEASGFDAAFSLPVLCALASLIFAFALMIRIGAEKRQCHRKTKGLKSHHPDAGHTSN